MKWNVPNIMTVARLGVLPLIVFLVWPGIENRETSFWAAMVYALSSVFDLVDGYIARKTGQVTVLGKFLDPLADKLFYLTTLIALLQLQGPRVPPLLVMIILARELTVTGLRGIAAAEGLVIAAGDGGKVKATFATLGMVGLLIHYPYVVHIGFASAIIDFHRAGLWITYLSAAFAVTSGWGYYVGFARAMRAREAAAAESHSA
jgi:CDP-diacylglycerol---glycerol-3-phosphate 3-phosphatidyltransferase